MKRFKQRMIAKEKRAIQLNKKKMCIHVHCYNKSFTIKKKKCNLYSTHISNCYFYLSLSKFFRMPEKCLIIFTFSIPTTYEYRQCMQRPDASISPIFHFKNNTRKKIVCPNERTGHHIFISSTDTVYTSPLFHPFLPFRII